MFRTENKRQLAVVLAVVFMLTMCVSAAAYAEGNGGVDVNCFSQSKLYPGVPICLDAYIYLKNGDYVAAQDGEGTWTLKTEPAGIGVPISDCQAGTFVYTPNKAGRYAFTYSTDRGSESVVVSIDPPEKGALQITGFPWHGLYFGDTLHLRAQVSDAQGNWSDLGNGQGSWSAKVGNYPWEPEEVALPRPNNGSLTYRPPQEGSYTFTYSYNGATASVPVWTSKNAPAQTPGDSGDLSSSALPELTADSSYEIKQSSAGPLLVGPAFGTSVSDVQENFTVPVEILNTKGVAQTGNTTLATGWQIRLSSAARAGETLSVVVTGDAVGTGKMSIAQLVRVARALTGAEPLSGPYLEAADLDANGTLTIVDLVRMCKLLTQPAQPGPSPSRPAATAAPKPTQTVSAAPSAATPAPKPTQTVSSAPSAATPAPQPTPTASATPRPVPTLVPEPSPVPTLVPEPSPVPTLVPEPSLAPTLIPEPSPVPTLIPEPSPVPTLVPEPSLAPTLVPEPSLAPTLVPEPPDSEEPSVSQICSELLAKINADRASQGRPTAVNVEMLNQAAQAVAEEWAASGRVDDAERGMLLQTRPDGRDLSTIFVTSSPISEIFTCLKVYTCSPSEIAARYLQSWGSSPLDMTQFGFGATQTKNGRWCTVGILTNEADKITGVAVGAAVPDGENTVLPEPAGMDRIREDTMAEMNRLRRNYGNGQLPDGTLSAQLNRAAQVLALERAADLSASLGERPDGSPYETVLRFDSSAIPASGPAPELYWVSKAVTWEDLVNPLMPMEWFRTPGVYFGFGAAQDKTGGWWICGLSSNYDAVAWVDTPQLLPETPSTPVEPAGPASPGMNNPDPGASAGDADGFAALQALVLEKTNAERAKKGLSPVAPNSALNQAATVRVTEMIRSGKFDHVRPDGSSYNTAFTMTDSTMSAENIFMSWGSGPSVINAGSLAVNSWIDSPGHYANMTHPDVRYMGIAAGYTTSGQWYVCQLFTKSPNISWVDSPKA